MALIKAVNPIVSTSAGHEMTTPGKETPPLPQRNGKRMKEKEFNEAVQKYLHEELVRCGIKHVDVDENSNDSLSTRAKRVNASGAHLHIDIHANAFDGILNDKGSGIETFCWFDTVGTSKKVAQVIHNHIMKGTPFKDRGVKNGNHLYMINSVKPISILVELGFMDNVYDVQFLLSDAYRRECAVELAKGICEVFGKPYVPKKEAPAPKPATPSKGETSVSNEVSNEVSNPGAFKDVPKGAYYNEALEYLKEAGIFNGKPDGTFAPNEPLTRAQSAVVVYGAIKHIEGLIEKKLGGK